MNTSPPTYAAEFWKSPHHICFGILTLGAGFCAGNLLALILGAAAYAIGWIYLPDMAFFHQWVDGRREAMRRQTEAAKVAHFVRRRNALLGSLTPARVERYSGLAEVCEGIESAGIGFEEQANPRLRRLDELMWTYLRLLTIEESLEHFLAIEEGEQVPMLVREAEHELDELGTEAKAGEHAGASNGSETRQRYITSRLERLEVLCKRLDRARQGRDNLALVCAEQDRLEQQIKLIRADAIAAKNADALSARIDATVSQLEQTNRWLAEMDDFNELAGNVPDTELRAGFGGINLPARDGPPPLPAEREFARQGGRRVVNN